MNLIKTLAGLTMAAATLTTTLTAAEARFSMPQHAVSGVRVAAMPYRAVAGVRFAAMPRRIVTNFRFAGVRPNLAATRPFMRNENLRLAFGRTDGLHLEASRLVGATGLAGHQPPGGAQPDLDVSGVINKVKEGVRAVAAAVENVLQRIQQ